MLKELLERLRNKKQNETPKKIEHEVKDEPKENHIFISKQNDIYKVEITDYISISEFCSESNSNKENSVLDSIHAAVFWNNDRQMVNKGTYFIINNNNHLYNILFTDRTIIINERTIKDLDEEEKENILKSLRTTSDRLGDFYTIDKSITFKPDKNDYNYYSAKHTFTGDTYYNKYYNKLEKFSFGNLDLSDEEAYEEISSLLTNLEEIDNINTILDVDSLRKNILEDIKEKQSKGSK